jgi:hypothetical protein
MNPQNSNAAPPSDPPPRGDLTGAKPQSFASHKKLNLKTVILSTVIILIFAGIAGAVFFLSGNVSAPRNQKFAIKSKAAETGIGCTVSGVVADASHLSTADICPTTGGTGMSNLQVSLWGIDPVQGETSMTTVSGADGTFYFSNVQIGGVYNVCAAVPNGYSHLCNVPRSDKHDPFTTQCAKIDTLNGCTGIRLNMVQTAPTPTPTIDPNLCLVTGHVWDMPAVPQPNNSCPTVGGTGMSNVPVEVWGLDPTSPSGEIYQTTTSDETGTFSFANIPAGVFNVCASVPSGYQRLCNIPRVDNFDPFKTQCAKIDTTSQNCNKISLDLTKVVVSPTPSVSGEPAITPPYCP